MPDGGAEHPRRATFVPVGLILDDPGRVLPMALHRTHHGTHRPSLSAERLSAAIKSGKVDCDPVAVRWLPPRAAAQAHLARLWDGATGNEGGPHKELRGVGVVLLAALAPGAVIEPERPQYGDGRSVRADLVARSGAVLLAAVEVGVVEGDSVLAQLLAKRAAPYVIVIPFAGAGRRSARGYAFRLRTTPVFASPPAVDLRAAWALRSAAGRRGRRSSR